MQDGKKMVVSPSNSKYASFRAFLPCFFKRQSGSVALAETNFAHQTSVEKAPLVEEEPGPFFRFLDPIFALSSEWALPSLWKLLASPWRTTTIESRWAPVTSIVPFENLCSEPFLPPRRPCCLLLSSSFVTKSFTSRIAQRDCGNARNEWEWLSRLVRPENGEM